MSHPISIKTSNRKKKPCIIVTADHKSIIYPTNIIASSNLINSYFNKNSSQFIGNNIDSKYLEIVIKLQQSEITVEEISYSDLFEVLLVIEILDIPKYQKILVDHIEKIINQDKNSNQNLGKDNLNKLFILLKEETAELP
jgi:hypothetical protein